MRKHSISSMSLSHWFCESMVFGFFILYSFMIGGGIFLHGQLNRIIYGYYALSLILLLRYLVALTKLIHPRVLEHWNQRIQNYHHPTLILIIVLLILEYTYLNFLYPIRGWDALHFYFPTANYFFITDDIPAANNPLSFYPTIKPPANVLYLTYSRYLSPEFTAELFPIVFIIGICCLLIILGDELSLSRREIYFGVILFLT
ncbi:MAG: hypothetical protein ACXAB7_19110, partial [Candidatus Kariarchaeaceae archaeon]